MLKLNLTSEPEWLDLGHGVRVRVVPCTSGVMAAARGSDAVEALVAAGASEAELALALARAMAGIAILDWEGVGDADGKPVPVNPEAAAALIDVWPLFEAFQARYVAKGLLLDQKKTPPRLRRVALRRGRRLLHGLPAGVPGLPGPAEPTGDGRGRPGLGPGSAHGRPAPGGPRRGARLGSRRRPRARRRPRRAGARRSRALAGDRGGGGAQHQREDEPRWLSAECRCGSRPSAATG